MPNYDLPRCKCLHCDYEWAPRLPQRPGVCPRCKSYNWDKMSQRKRKERTMSDNELSMTPEDMDRLLATPLPAGYSVPIGNDYLRKRFGPLGDCDCLLTTQHSASSYGLPVLVVRGTPYGPGDLPGLVLRLVPSLADSARRAGWTVEEYEPEWRQQEREADNSEA